MKPYHWLLTTMALLLGGCKMAHFPIELRFLYYPQSPSICSPGVLVKGQLSSGFGQSNRFEWVWFASSGTAGTTSIPLEGVHTPIVRFFITNPTVAPTPEDALSNLPSPELWKGHYFLVFASDGVMPELTLQCSETSTPVVVTAVSDLPRHAIVVIEDPTKPGNLQVVKQPFTHLSSNSR